MTLFQSPQFPGNFRREAINTIETTFLDMENKMNLDGSFTIEQANFKLTQIVRNIMGELKRNKELMTLLADVYTYDDYIFTHSFNVTLYTLAIGVELNINNKNLQILGLGAILHDVGKMLVPLEVLRKPGKLTEKEFEQIQKHADYGFHLIKNVHTVSLLVANCAYQHHERLDGSGYPRGIKGMKSFISARSLLLPMCLMPLLPIGFTVRPCCRIGDWKSFMAGSEKIRQYDHRGFPQGDCHLSQWSIRRIE